MKELKSYLPEITDALLTLDPYRIVLFGSLAQGDGAEGNDIDLAVVLDTEELPQSFEERMENRLSVRNAILSLSHEIPIDLIVYTKSEYLQLSALNQPMINEIDAGRVLYDKAG